MSFLLGPISGAVVAGGIYYGFSNLITKRTEQHQRDLHILSLRLSETPQYIQAPPSAADRVQHNGFKDTLKSRWNQEIAFVATGFRSWGSNFTEWGSGLIEKLALPANAKGTQSSSSNNDGREGSATSS